MPPKQSETTEEERSNEVEESGGEGTEESHKEEEESDLPFYHKTEADHMIEKVYGDYIHSNDGSQLSGGIIDDKFWQDTYRKMVVLPSKIYSIPNGKIGNALISKGASILEDVQSWKCNSEKFLIYWLVMLQKSPGVKAAADIRRRLSRRLKQWDEGLFQMLTETTIRDMEKSLSLARALTTPEQRAKIFNEKILSGELRSAVRFITEREKGGLLYPDQIDEKTGRTVGEVLESKHPDPREPGPLALRGFDLPPPEFVDLDITEETVEKTAAKLGGGAGLGGINAMFLQKLLLQHGGASRMLRNAVASFARWMANDFPPWAAYRALMGGRLVGIDKMPGVRPVGIGETWRRLIAKVVLNVAAVDAKEEAGIDQLCAGLEAGIEGGIHATRALWDEVMAMEDEYGFLLIDAFNAFNEKNRKSMVLTVRYLWPAGARFTFNCYKHWSVLIIRGRGGNSAIIIHSKEGVTQGDPLAMFAYGIGILPLIRMLKANHPSVEQPWYADDAGAMGKFQAIKDMFEELQEIGPDFGYFPEPSKSILVVHPARVEEAKNFFATNSFKVKTGYRYLGGFIGSIEAQEQWLDEKIEDWKAGLHDISENVTRRFPQTAYAGVAKSFQQEWQFVQRVVPDIGDRFAGLEEIITDHFLPALFGEAILTDEYRRPLAALPVKKAGLALPNPTKTAKENYETSTQVCSHLIGALRGRHPFQSTDHTSVRNDIVSERTKRVSDQHDKTLKSILSDLDPSLARTIRRGTETGLWLTVLPNRVNGTQLSSQEFTDALCLRYGQEPSRLPAKCDGCGKAFSIRHGLECKTGGLIIQRHNEVVEELTQLLQIATTGGRVRLEPLINTESITAKRQSSKDEATASRIPSQRSRNGDEALRGDILVRGLFENGSDTILDVRITDVDSASSKSIAPEKALERHEREKKRKYLEKCLDQRRSFVPFVASTDGLLGREAKILLKKVAIKIAEKWQRPYSVVCGLVRSRMSIAVVRATHLTLRGSRITPDQLGARRVQWSDGAGLSLYHHDF